MFKGSFEKFNNKVWLSSPTMHGSEQKYVNAAFETNWVSVIGENVDAVEQIAAEKVGTKYAISLSCCTAALHLAVKLAGEKLYGKPAVGQGSVAGKYVFCSDLTFDATVNPVVYEGGTPVFIDTDPDTWNMDPVALEAAFEKYLEVKLVVMAHLYGFPGDIKRIKSICEKHGALLIEDAAESLGATVDGQQTGSFGDISAISFNGNKIITGSAGGCLLTNNMEDALIVRKWANQSKENASWYQHTETGYNYRMSNIIAGVIRGQYEHLDEHIDRKKEIFDIYAEGFKNLPVKMNPVYQGTVPNYWLSCIEIDEEAMCQQNRTETEATYMPEVGKSCPTEILEQLSKINAEGRPIWKPMHLQPMFRNMDFISLGNDVGADVFRRGMCLPSDIKMTEEQQRRIIEVVKSCFK